MVEPRFGLMVHCLWCYDHIPEGANGRSVDELCETLKAWMADHPAECTGKREED